jgi:hypothetical protein
MNIRRERKNESNHLRFVAHHCEMNGEFVLEILGKKEDQQQKGKKNCSGK